jgi:ankyrin repeat protein
MSCTHTADCQLFPQFAAEPALKIWKQHFCEGDFKKCARYQRALTGISVPLELLPNGKALNVERSKEEVNINVLFNAIQKNRIGMVQSIFKARISEGGIRNSAGITPLMFAAELGNLNMVKLLIELGCNPHAKNHSGKNALQIANDGGHAQCAQFIQLAMGKTPVTEIAYLNPANSDEENMSQVLRFLRKFNPFKKAS